MGGRSAKRAANQAAEASRAEAANYREQSALLQRRTEDQAKKAQRVLMRSLRARGSGFFETDFTPGSAVPMGGAGGTFTA